MEQNPYESPNFPDDQGKPAGAPDQSPVAGLFFFGLIVLLTGALVFLVGGVIQ
jgi:hypothetical protein